MGQVVQAEEKHRYDWHGQFDPPTGNRRPPRKTYYDAPTTAQVALYLKRGGLAVFGNHPDHLCRGDIANMIAELVGGRTRIAPAPTTGARPQAAMVKPPATVNVMPNAIVDAVRAAIQAEPVQRLEVAVVAAPVKSGLFPSLFRR